MQPQTQRIAWVDVLKGIGIYLIYVVHLPGALGNFNVALMVFAVPLFFFAGGLTDRFSRARSWKEFLRRRAQRILIPYVAFGVATMLVRVLVDEDKSLGNLITWAKELLLGRRNHIFAVALWFLPCYFVMTLCYRALRQLLKKRWLILLVCAGVSLTVRLFIESWEPLPWSIDSAGRYLFYYALGDALFAPLEAIRAGGAKRWQTAVFYLLGAGSVGLFLLGYIYGRGYLPSLVGVELPFAGQVAELIGMALVGLYTALLLAFALQTVPGLARLGQASLLLCCTESMVKLVLPLAFETVGLTILYDEPVYCLLSAALFVAAAYWAMARPVQAYLPWMMGRFSQKISRPGKDGEA